MNRSCGVLQRLAIDPRYFNKAGEMADMRWSELVAACNDPLLREGNAMVMATVRSWKEEVLARSGAA